MSDESRLVAYWALRDVTADEAYSNLVLGQRLRGAPARDAGFVTELVNGTLRTRGTLDAIIEAASRRATDELTPEVLDVLRLGAYQLLMMRVPPHAGVTTSVDLATDQIGRRVSGLVNAVLRRVAERDWAAWLAELTAGHDERDALALRHAHPRWIVDAFADVLPPDELGAALEADNLAPHPTLAVRPGLLSRADLVHQCAGTPTRYSPWGVRPGTSPAAVPAVRDGLAGVQDEGSQLVVLAATRALSARGAGSWLDLCAGPGGKTALLRGMADGRFLVAAESRPHRAKLVVGNLRAFDPNGHQVVVADGTRPAWRSGFGFVLADVPCTGLGSLRRRAEARWRRQPSDLAALTKLQSSLLDAALQGVAPGGVVAYATCSPHRDETAGVVVPLAAKHGAEILDTPSYLPEVSDCAATDTHFVQLWPHRHGTDAMFLALLRRPRDG